jgi:outer membrane receptor protein involved in Fe transport
VKKLVVLFCFLFILGSLAPLAFGQSLISGDIAGTVTDASGAVVPEISVTLHSSATGQQRTAVTSSTGFYRFSLLQPGSYTITVASHGFASQSKQIDVVVGQSITANFALSVATKQEVVEVTGETGVLQLENGNSGTTFTSQLINNLPNPGGDLTQYAQLAPGSVMATGGGYGNFTSNGLPANSNVLTVNGMNDMDPYFNINNSGATNLSLGANEISEAAVISNAYSGAYGQQAGAQVNYVTKSGSNDLHGALKYNWTGRALSARDYFNPATDPQPFTNNNQWAASIGGPIQKNKTFFFINNEGLRYILATSTPVYIPSPAFQTALLNNIASGGQYGDEIPSAAVKSELPYYQKWLGLYNQANGASHARLWTAANDPGNTNGPGCGDFNFDGQPCVSQFESGAGQLSTEWILSSRVDHNFSDYDRAYVRYRMDRGVQATYTDPISPDLNATSTQPAYDGQLQWTHIFKSGATNQFISGLDWYAAPFVSNPKGYTTFPMEIEWDDSPFASIGGEQFNFPQGRNVTQYQFVDDFAMPKGNHTLKFGVNYRRYDITNTNFTTYTESPRMIVWSTSDFFNGIADDFRQRFPSRTSEPIAMYGIGIYGEDEWKVSSSLKLTLALRVEHNSNPVCQTDCFSQLSNTWEGTSHTDWADVPYNQVVKTGLHQAFNNTTAMAFAPRFGFAWQPFNLKDTVVRGGFGLFYDAIPGGMIDNFVRNFPGFVTINNQSGLYGVGFPTWAPGSPLNAWDQNAASASALVTGYANGSTQPQIVASLPAGFRFVAPSITVLPDTLKTPRYQKWNLEVQQALGKKLVMSVNYVGSHGIFLTQPDGYMNAYKAAGIYPLPTTKPDGRFQTVTEYTNAGVSNYNGLTASLSQHMTDWLQFQMNYTWSHSFDTISNEGGNTAYYSTDSVQSQFYPLSLMAQNYANSDYDVRHNFNLSYVLTPKFDQWLHAPKWLGADWTYSGALVTRTGTPFTVTDTGVSVSASAITSFYPLWNGAGSTSCNSDAVTTPCLNANNFAEVSPETGMSLVRRNSFRGPGFFNFDMNLTKGVHLPKWENSMFVFGVSGYNIFNHPNFGTPASEVGGSLGTFGTISNTVSVPTSPYGSFVGAAASGRIIQLNADFKF